MVGAFILLASLQSAASAPPPPVTLRYAIDADLQPASHRLNGRTQITWLRRERPVRELRFQLFLNAWRNGRSTWMRRSIAVVPPDVRWGGIDIVSLTVQTPSSSRDLTTAARFVAPDDRDADDRTVLEVDVPETIGTADPVSVQLQWTAVVPSYLGDTGARGRHFFFAHWSPQLCDVAPDGWVCPQADPSGRTPAEAADYTVRLGVPRDWLVGATGRSVSRTVRDDRFTYEFHQPAVRGFAWTASPDFVDIDVRAPKESSVDIRLLMQREHGSQASRVIEAVDESLIKHREFAPYPYDHLTIVDAAWQTHTGGVGYPALVTVAGRWLTSNATSDIEADVARGVAQQWWGNLVAIDPGRDGVADRALADYSHARVVKALLNRHRQIDAYAFYHERFFGGFVPWVFSGIRLNGPDDGRNSAVYRAYPTVDSPLSAGLSRVSPVAALRAKAALAFATLERYVGWSAMQRALTTVAERYAFQNVRREQVFATLAAAAGQDLSWFFRQAFDRSAVFDYAVTRLTTEPQSSDSCEFAPCFRTVVVVGRLGEAEFTGTAQEPLGPYQAGRALTILVRFADGSTVVDRWDGRSRWRLFEFKSRSAAVSAEIDPDRVLLLDLHTVNNSMTREPAARRAATRWAAHWAIWLQDLLLTYASLI